MLFHCVVVSPSHTIIIISGVRLGEVRLGWAGHGGVKTYSHYT